MIRSLTLILLFTFGTYCSETIQPRSVYENRSRSVYKIYFDPNRTEEYLGNPEKLEPVLYKLVPWKCDAELLNYLIDKGMSTSLMNNEKWVERCFQNCCFEMVDNLVTQGHLSLEGMKFDEDFDFKWVYNNCPSKTIDYLIHKENLDFGLNSDVILDIASRGDDKILDFLDENHLILTESDYEKVCLEGRGKYFLNIDAKRKYPNIEQNAIEYAIYESNLSTVQKLIKMGANLNGLTAGGRERKPLLHTTYESWESFFKTIAEAPGVDLNAHDSENQTVLFYALRRNDLSTVEWLIDHHVDLSCEDIEGYTPLTYAYRYCKKEVTQAILTGLMNSKTLDIGINRKNAYGNAPIHCIYNNHQAGLPKKKFLTALIALGADVNLTNRYGLTPFLNACFRGDASDLDLLLKNGARIDQVDPNQENALIYAIDGGNYKVIPHLLTLGVSLSPSRNHKHPLLYALDDRYITANIIISIIRSMDFSLKESKDAAKEAIWRLHCKLSLEHLDQFRIEVCKELGEKTGKNFDLIREKS